MTITIDSRSADTYTHRGQLYRLGMRYANRKWSIKTSDKGTLCAVVRYCTASGLPYDVLPDRYARSTSYRLEFITAYSTQGGYYRCAYCGRKIREEEMTVDHI